MLQQLYRFRQQFITQIGSQTHMQNLSKLALIICLIPPFLAAKPADAQDSSQSSGPVPVETSPDSSIPSSTTSGTTIPASSDGVLTGQRFTCQSQSGQYTVMYQPKSQPGQYFPWASPSTMGGGWSPDRRCNEIARRLEQYRPDGLVEMKTSAENGYNIICATTERNPGCRIILTVPVGQDPNSIRDRVFGNLATADTGQQTISVPTFIEGDRSRSKIDLAGLLGGISRGRNSQILTQDSSNNSTSFSGNGIYLKPYLDPSDGGTGTRLVNGFTSQGNRFNPSNFR